MQAIKKEEKGLLKRGLYAIIRFNRDEHEKKSNVFIDIFDIDKSLFLERWGVGLKTYHFLKENPNLVKQTILNNRYYISNLGYLTKKKLSDVKDIKRETKMHKEVYEEFDKIINSQPNDTNKCTECEKEIISDLADLQIELDKEKNYNRLLENCLDTKDELCKALREDNENLRYKNELYLEKIKKLEVKDV